MLYDNLDIILFVTLAQNMSYFPIAYILHSIDIT